ncbi:MAG TPA: hypothetical protein VJ551_00450 [Nitrososphaeraceae archaeon]|nr:hypothetical protein [Nitrososphaeraceae archaeon]
MPLVSVSNGEENNNHRKKITVSRVYAVSTLLAVIIAIPAIAVTFVMHYVIRADFFLTLGAGLITLFIAMGFGYKLSKKFVKVLSGNSR